MAKAIQEEQSRRERGVANPDITLAQYSVGWLQKVRLNLTEGTHRTYGIVLRHQILPQFGEMNLRQIRRRDVKLFLLDKMQAKSRQYVRNMYVVLHRIFEEAIEDELLEHNPARWPKGTQTFRLRQTKQETQDGVKAMTPEQLVAFEAVAKRTNAGTMFLVMARTGIRIGEALGLQWSAIDLEGRHMQVRQQWLPSRKVSGLKGKAVRRVDLSQDAVDALRQHRAEQWRRALAAGRPASSVTWLFACGERPYSRRWVTFRIAQILKRAGLPDHFTPHSLRHTYATLMLSNGATIQYVQQQLGHRSIQLTVDLYGSWAQQGNATIPDKLDKALEHQRQMKLFGAEVVPHAKESGSQK